MADRLSLEDGRLTIAGSEERYILIPLRAYEAIIDAMTGLAGEAAAGPLYYLGKRIGRGLVEDLKRLLGGNRSLEGIVREYARYLAQLGFGRVEVEELRGSYARVKLISPPSLAAAAAGAQVLGRGRQRGVCHLERGMLAAVLDALTGRHHMAVEKEYGFEPEPYCVIEVAPMQVAAAAAIPAVH